MRPPAGGWRLTKEISAYHGVSAVRGRVIGNGRDPQIVLTITPAPAADMHALHQRIETEAIAHARQALSHPSLPIQLDLI